jgi:hypothetical protein
MLTDGLGRIDARIAEIIIPHGEFASWRADRAVGNYDLNTFPDSRRSDRRGLLFAA